LLRVLDAMCCADRNVDRFAGANDDLLVVECHFRRAFNYEPVFCALRVFLVTEPCARKALDPFHFETAIFLEHRVSSPRPAIKLPHTRSSLNSMVERTLGHKKTQRLETNLCVSLLPGCADLGVCFQRQIDHGVASLN